MQQHPETILLQGCQGPLGQSAILEHAAGQAEGLHPGRFPGRPGLAAQHPHQGGMEVRGAPLRGEACVMEVTDQRAPVTA